MDRICSQSFCFPSACFRIPDPASFSVPLSGPSAQPLSFPGEDHAPHVLPHRGCRHHRCRCAVPQGHQAEGFTRSQAQSPGKTLVQWTVLLMLMWCVKEILTTCLECPTSQCCNTKKNPIQFTLPAAAFCSYQATKSRVEHYITLHYI